MSLINTVKKHYTNIPLWVTNSLASLYYVLPSSKRYGKVFETQKTYLEYLETVDSSVISELVNIEFINTVKHAYENVPYYRKLFNEHGLSLSSFKDIRDIKKIPFLTKELLVKHREELIATNIDRRRLQYITTSGSTGNPVGFFVDPDSTMKEWAYTLNIWKRVGYKPDSSRLLLRGKTFWAQNNKGENWQYDALRRELSINIFDMCEKNLEQYCNVIEKYKPEFVHGYMSAITELCKYIEKRKTGLKHQFRAILAVSENVLDSQRNYVEQILNTRVFSFYGHSERLVIAGECECSKEYHVEPLYGFAEIIDNQGRPLNNNSTGELVATGFCNKGMPMLRFKTGDMANWSQTTTCNCGRPHIRMAGVHGRWKQDVLINVDKSLVSLTAINMHSDVFDRIVRYQFYQDTIGEVIMKILPNEKFSNNDKILILKELHEKTQGKINYKILLVNSLPIKKNGKYLIVDQRLKINEFN